MIFGSVVHKALDCAHKMAKEMKEQWSAEESQKIWDDVFFGRIPIEHWERQADGTKIITAEKVNLPSPFYNSGLEGFKNYCEKELTEVRNFFKSEFTLDVKAGDHNIKVIIDRLDIHPDKFRIVEFKTGSRIPARSELAENLQLAIQGWSIRKWDGPAKKIEPVYYSFLSNKSIGLSRKDPDMFYTDQFLDNTEKYLIEICNEITNTKVWPERLNNFCPECPIKQTCKIYTDDLKGLYGIENYGAILAGDPEKVSEIYLENRTRMSLLDKRKDDLKAILTAQVEALGGEFNVKEGKWYLKLTEKQGYTVEAQEYHELRFQKVKLKKEKQ